MKHGVHEILCHFEGTKHFPRSQRLCLKTSGWRVLDYEGNPMREEEVERQWQRILKPSQVVRDREYPLSEGLTVDSSCAVDVILPMLAEVSTSIITITFERNLPTRPSALVPVHIGC